MPAFDFPADSHIETRWDWTNPPNAGSPPDGLNGLKSRPATTVSILLPAARIDELEYPVKKEVKLLLDQFSTPRVMREAIENIKRYIKSIPPGSLKNIVEALSELADTRDFLEKIDDILLAEAEAMGTSGHTRPAGLITLRCPFKKGLWKVYLKRSGKAIFCWRWWTED